jgi:hypothetical protein
MSKMQEASKRRGDFIGSTSLGDRMESKSWSKLQFLAAKSRSNKSRPERPKADSEEGVEPGNDHLAESQFS